MKLLDTCSSITDTTKVETGNEKETTISLDSAISLDRKPINETDEKRLVRKLDLRIMPLFCLFYFADFLDRANIGNAALAGLEQDLNMTSNQLGSSISAFFVTYIVFEIPSNLVLEKTNAAKWLSFIMFVWGVATLATAFVNDFAGLFVARLVLGAAESGYIPGILFLLSKVYKPQEFSMRVSILLTMATLSGIVSGPLTYLVSSLNGKHGLHGWQYIFIIEGIPTILLSIVSYFFLFDDLQHVGWLTDEQKELQLARFNHTPMPTHSSTFRTLLTALLDWKTWAFGFIMFLNSISIVSFGVFSPVLIKGFGFDTSTAQLLTAPPCVTGTLGILLGGYLVSRFNCRSPILIIGSSIVAISFFCLYMFYDKWALYSVLLIIPIGVGMQASAALGWSALNYPNVAIRAIAVAAILMVGNVGSIVASFLFKSSDAPRYGFAVLFNCGAAVLSICLSGLTGVQLYRLNRRLDNQPPNEYNSFRYFI